MGLRQLRDRAQAQERAPAPGLARRKGQGQSPDPPSHHLREETRRVQTRDRRALTTRQTTVARTRRFPSRPSSPMPSCRPSSRWSRSLSRGSFVCVVFCWVFRCFFLLLFWCFCFF